MEKVERIQYQATLAITGTWQGSSRFKIYEETGWESLSDRRNCRRVFQICKIMNKNTLSYLKEKLPPNRREMFSGKVRTTFHTIKYKEVPSIGVLKNDILSLIRPVSKRFFKIHDPDGLRYLFQLRLSLSPLKGHKWWYNFSDTPSGIWHCSHGIEGTSHFLFSCRSHMIHSRGAHYAKRRTDVRRKALKCVGTGVAFHEK